MGIRDLTRREFLKQTAELSAAGGLIGLLARQKVSAADLPKAGPADWPRYGYDLHNTRFNANEKTIGVENAGKLKVKWKFDTLDNWIIYQTPAVIGDTLFFGAGRYIYSLESGTGKLKWKFDWGVNREWEQANATSMNPLWWGARSSPQYYEGRIYFGVSSCVAYCLDAATGKQIWRKVLLDPDAAERNSAQIFYSPIVYAGKVYIAYSGSNATIFCLDADTGAIRWRFRVAQDVPLELETGGGSPWTSGAIDEQRNIVYNVTGNNKVIMPNLGLYSESIVAHDMDTGELLWYYQVHPQDSFDLDFNAHPIILDAAPPPRIRGNVRNCVAAGNKGGIYCLDRYTGQFFWKVMLGQICASCGPEFNAIAAAYNNIFLQWNSASSARPFSSSAALNAYSGDVQWMVVNPAGNSSPIAVANGVMYQGFVNGKIEALDARNGRTIWEFALPSAFRGGFSIANGAVYCGNGEAGEAKIGQNGRTYSLHCFTPDGK
jgi:glucose dehydrogenase